MFEEERLHADALDQARFARRHLRDDRGQHRVAAAGDAGDLHVGVEFLQIHVAVGFPERSLRLEILRIDESFDHDLRLGGDQEIDGLRPHHIDRCADERAGDAELVERFGQLLHGGEGDARRRAQDDRGGQLLDAARAQLFPVIVDARTQLQRRIHSEPSPRFHLPAIVAHVLDARVRDPW